MSLRERAEAVILPTYPERPLTLVLVVTPTFVPPACAS